MVLIAINFKSDDILMLEDINDYCINIIINSTHNMMIYWYSDYKMLFGIKSHRFTTFIILITALVNYIHNRYKWITMTNDLARIQYAKISCELRLIWIGITNVMVIFKSISIN